MTGNSIYMIDVGFLEDKKAFDHWYSMMPKVRKDKIDACKPEKAKRSSLGAGILLEEGLKRLGVKDYQIELEENGKPFVNGVFFNLSHSKEKAVCAFSNQQVGVDIEKVKTFSEALTKYVYNDEEIQYIKYRSKTTEEENRLFTLLWTVKESFMKYDGKGLSMNPARIFIDMEHDFLPYYDGEKVQNIFFSRHEVGDYCLTVCSSQQNFSDEIISFDGRVM